MHNVKPFSIAIIFILSLGLSAYADTSAKDEIKYRASRKKMVEEAIVGYGTFEAKIIQAFLQVPRHEFVLPQAIEQAYDDKALPIGNNQKMGRPYEVARMTQLLGLKGGEKILELGTGSGYHTAILSHLCADVYTVDIQEDMLKNAELRLTRLGYKNIHFKSGEGTLGWPEAAPFDAIIVSFAADNSMIEELAKQLREGGRMVIPVNAGDGTQQLKLVIKTDNKVQVKNIFKVNFIAMIKTNAPQTAPITTPSNSAPSSENATK